LLLWSYTGVWFWRSVGRMGYYPSLIAPITRPGNTILMKQTALSITNVPMEKLF